MRVIKFYKCILFFACCVPALWGHAQGSTIKITTDKNRILIGEPILLTIEANIPDNEPIRLFQFDTIPHFEVLEKRKPDTVNTSDGTVLTLVISITSFDSGHWVIPPFVLNEKVKTDSVTIDVGYSEFDAKKPYHDIKDILEVNAVKEKNYAWMYYTGGAALLLILLLIYFSRKKKLAVTPPAPRIDVYKDAISKLDALLIKKPVTKVYYSLMVDILRTYLQHREGIHSLQATTDDLVLQLRKLKIAAVEDGSLPDAMRLSDFVKFAKYIPETKDDQFVFDTIKNAIISIEKGAVQSAPSATE